ncbi:hypothetical protein DSL72_008946 [Monilinia vaccinii-corymbosi]|uniref:FAD-binding domain-containing protein n=1 Tax=Monilinia vaccinii-corymbosi TaxID=61207 RepID=A0A8A3PSX1_9HELO|nr:hypothetical protein DSL72_008946 [Monilinia vaccinii-corymbosi]
MAICADGARSTVRRLLLGPTCSLNTRLSDAATFVQANFSREQALLRLSFPLLFLAASHPNNLFTFFGLQDAPGPEEPEGGTFFFYILLNSSMEAQDAEAKGCDNAARLKEVKEMGKGYTEP